MPTNILGEKLKLLRLQFGFTQQQVADVLGIERSAYTYYELGRTKELKGAMLQTLSRLYNVELSYFCDPECTKPVFIRSPKTQKEAALQNIQSSENLTSDEKKLLSIFRSCSQKKKEALLNAFSDIVASK